MTLRRSFVAVVLIALVAAASIAASPRQTTTKLTVAVASEPPTLNGLRESSTAVFTLVTQNILETLVRVNTTNRKVEPLLATDWTRDGPRRWNIKIRRNVKFHDGSTMSVNDVVASFNYVASTGSAFLSYFPTGTVARRLNATTMRVTSPKPNPLLPYQLQFVSVSSAKAIARGPELMATTPIGTGPYRLASWNRGQNLNLTRFNQYWGPRPTIRDVSYIFRSLSSVRADAVRTGEAQLADGLSANDLSGTPKIAPVTGLATYSLLLNSSGQTDGSIMTDVRVRRAVYMAIDKRAITGKIYAGYARLARGNIVPPLVLGFNPKIDDYAYNPGAARDLINQANANGKSISFVCTNQTFLNVVETCQVITASLQQIGLNVNLQTPPFAQWLELYRNGPAGKNRPDILFGTPGDETLDMANKVAPTYFRSWKSGGGGAVIEDPQLAAMVAAAQGEADLVKREKIEQAMSKRVRDQAYMVPLFAPHNLWGMSRNVSFKPLATRNLFLSSVKLG